MYLREKLDERKLIKTKIKELKHCLLSELDIVEENETVEALLSYVDLLQNINLVINKVNQQTIISIGDTEISTTVAVEIRKAIKTKINVITQLINNTGKKLNILILMKQRDILIEEYNSINNTIRLTDWRIKLD